MIDLLDSIDPIRPVSPKAAPPWTEVDFARDLEIEARAWNWKRNQSTPPVSTFCDMY